MTLLDRLAERAGIEPGYHDIWGTYFEIPADTKIAILEAMGLPAATEEDQAASLAGLEARPWRRLAEPVVVAAAEAQPVSVAVTVPADSSATLGWRLVTEDGAASGGDAGADRLDLLEGRVVDGARLERRALVLPDGLPTGYHRLSLTVGADQAETVVIVAPGTCWGPEDVAVDTRFFGVACQLYSLRSAANWGIGDFGDLRDLALGAAAVGADIVGLNPLHALFPVDPEQASPYSPASRDWLNVLYIDVDAVPGFAECEAAQRLVDDPDFRRRLKAARESAMVEYGTVKTLVLPVLECLFAWFRDRHLAQGTDLAREFQAFREGHGQTLRRFATFMALQQHFAGGDPTRFAWWTWPEDCRHPDAPGALAFRRDHADRVEFQEYLQWIADRQLRAVAMAGRDAGLRIGLYRDLAVGSGPASAAAWASPAALVRDVSIGAPPDLYNRKGQNWGLAPLNPLALSEQAFQPFIAALRANMRHAGAIRIDHVMALLHLYWVPQGEDADKGAYVAYPFEDLLRIVALESRRNRCLVIGEDLGTVPEGFRPAMAEAGILSYRVMQFERVGDGLFKRPGTYPTDSLVTVGTHDLPTLAGFWTARDVEWRRDLGLYPDPKAVADAFADRAADRRRLIDALIDAGLWPAEPFTDTETLAPGTDLAVAVHRFLATTPSRLMMVQAEDALQDPEQANLPGTIDEHPNWRRRLRTSIDRLFADPAAAPVFAAVAAERSRR